MNEAQFDRQLHDWLRRGPSGASPRVLEAVAAHVRSRPAGRSLRDRLSGVTDVLVPRRPQMVVLRPVVLLALLALAFALGAFVYGGWQQLRVVTPIPSPTPTPPASVSPQPTSPDQAGRDCPPGSNPREPGDPGQVRPRIATPPAIAIDANSQLVVLPTDEGLWLFDLCKNEWRQSSYALVEFGVPVYVPDSDRTVIIGLSATQIYDAATDSVVRMGSHPLPGGGDWSAVYDPIGGMLLARDGSTARMWWFDAERDAWQEIVQLGDVPQVRNRGGADLAVSADAMAYDRAADRVVLYRPNSPGLPAETYEFDPRTSTWSRTATPTPSLEYSFYDVVRVQAAYDDIHDRTVLYNRGRVIGYNAVSDTWQTLLDQPGVKWDASGTAMAFDSISGQIVVLGGAPTTDAGWLDDVVALDLETVTWTTLLAQSPPLSFSAVGPLRACPADTNPNVLGPVNQERPPLGLLNTRAVFDRDSGQVVVLADEPAGWGISKGQSRIWTFDVCTNTWKRSRAEPIMAGASRRGEAPTLVYDAAHDTTVIFDTHNGKVLAYDADTDTLAEVAVIPAEFRPLVSRALYRSATGEILVLGDAGARLWVYDLLANQWSELGVDGSAPSQTGSGLPAYDESADRIIVYSKLGAAATGYEFDFVSGSWSRQQPDPPALGCVWVDLCYGEVAFDEAHARTVVFSSNRVAVYDAGTSEWQVVFDLPQDSSGISGRIGIGLVYDPVNQRTIAFDGLRWGDEPGVSTDEIVAFDLDDNSWAVLLEASAP